MVWPFGKSRKREPEGPPAGLNDLHNYETESGSGPYVEANATFATRTGRELPFLPHQDELLVHHDRPPADEPPGEWYKGSKAKSNYERSLTNEHPANTAQGEVRSAERVNWTGNPNLHPPEPTRPTRAPSQYSFTRDMQAGAARQLNGYHASMASIQKTYPVQGMTPAYRSRNTYRVDPPPRDAYIVDMPSGDSSRTVDSVYQSPNIGTTPTANRSFRLV